MGLVQMLEGDFAVKSLRCNRKEFIIYSKEGSQCVLPFHEIATLDTLEEQEGGRASGICGGVLLGLFGGLLGLLAAPFLLGDSKRVMFEAIFKDGKRMKAITDFGTFTEIHLGVFGMTPMKRAAVLEAQQKSSSGT